MNFRAIAMRLVLSACMSIPAFGNSFTVLNSGASDYLINDAADPTLTLYRGRTYTFNINAAGHPFWIKSNAVTGTGNAYTNGVTGNGTQVGALIFTVPTNAPNTLHYICQFHAAMTGVLNIENSPQRGWWRFEEISTNANDSSGRGMNGIISGMHPGEDDGASGYSTDVPGMLIVDGNLTNANLYSLRFSKTGGVVRILEPALLALTNNPASVTIEAFIKVNSHAYPMRILDARLTNPPPPTFRTALIPFVGPVAPRPRLEMFVQSDLTTNTGVTVGTTLAIDPSPVAQRHWHHVAYVLNNTNISFFIDYQLMSESSLLPFGYVPGPFAKINEISLGGIASAAFANFDGWIDEIRVTDRALAPTQFLRVVNGLAPGIRDVPSVASPALVTVVTEEGRRYQLQGTTNLLAAPQAWTNLTTIVTGNLFYTTFGVDGDPAQFYRVLSVP